MGVDARGRVNEIVLLHQVSDSTAVHALAWTTRAESGGLANQGLHDVEGGHVNVLPGDRLEGKRDVGLGTLSPCAVFSTNVLRLLASILVLGDTMELSEALSDEVNILTMTLDATGNDEGLLGSDAIHHELLHDTSVNVSDVVLETEAGHTEGLVSVGSSKEKVLVISEGIIVGQVLVQIVRFLILGTGNVSSENGSGFKSAINHHLEHVSNIVLDAVTSEICAFLIILHLHVTTGHLDHTVVDSLVGVLEGLQVGVLQGEEGS